MARASASATKLRKTRAALGMLLRIAVVSVVTFTARASLADHYRVPSGSMEPTVQIDDHIVVNKAAYGIRVPLTKTWLVRYSAPARGDVVVLEADHPEVLLKRVVAISGDWVEVRNGRVLLDGRPAADPTANVEAGPGIDFGPMRVPAGKLLVLGDNRGNSRDGRFFGWIDERQVLGHAMAIVGRDGAPTLTGL